MKRPNSNQLYITNASGARASTIIALIWALIAITAVWFLVAVGTVVDANDWHPYLVRTLIIFGVCTGIYIVLIVLLYRKVYTPIHGMETVLQNLLQELPPDSAQELTKKISLENAINLIIMQRKKSWHREFTLEYLRKEAELNALQAQINPHFLYNTLETIRGLALIRDVPEIATMAETLSSMFRNNMRKANVLIPLEEELQNAENYMIIQHFRFPDKFLFFKHIDAESENILACKVPNLILQPIIENAIFHGLEPLTRAGEIHLYAYNTETRLVIKVVDNGCGIPQDKLDEINLALWEEPLAEARDISDSKHAGIALTNIGLRLRHQFGPEYGLTVSSTVNIGTEVELSLPCKW